MDHFKSVYPFDLLVVWSIGALAYALIQSDKFIGVRFIPNVLILGMFLKLSVFKGLSCFFIKYGHGPVKEKLVRVNCPNAHSGDKRLYVCECVHRTTGSACNGPVRW